MSDKSSPINLIQSFLRFVISSATRPEQTPPPEVKQLKLDDVPLDELKKEKVALDNEEKKTLLKLREIEGRKRQFFSDGVKANTSDREKLVLARKIKGMDVEAANLDGLLQIFAKQTRVLDGLIQVKERSLILSTTGSSILSQLSMDDVMKYVNMSSVDGEFQMSKFDDLLRAMELNASIAPEYREESDVMEIFNAMKSVQEAGDAAPEKIDEALQSLKKEKTNLEDPSLN